MIPVSKYDGDRSGDIRLNRFLAMCGHGSRRNTESLIKSGQVQINDEVITDPACRVGRGDKVRVNGIPVNPEKPIYLVMNKPIDVVCSVKDSHNRTIIEILPLHFRRYSLFPAGRLDKDSTGLIVLTNDGELTNYLTHPGFGVTKGYLVRLDRAISDDDLEKWRKGIVLNGKRVVPVDLYRSHISHGPDRVFITLGEGMKREIRRMAKELGYKVRELERCRIGKLVLRNLPQGGVRSFPRHILTDMIEKGGSV